MLCFPGGSVCKASASNAGDLGSIPGLGRSPGDRNSKLLCYSCLENFMDRRWCATEFPGQPGGLQPMGSQRVGHDCYMLEVYHVVIHKL